VMCVWIFDIALASVRIPTKSTGHFEMMSPGIPP